MKIPIKNVSNELIQSFTVKWTSNELNIYQDGELLDSSESSPLGIGSKPLFNPRHEYISVLGRFTSTRSYSNVELLRIIIKRVARSTENIVNTFDGENDNFYFT